MTKTLLITGSSSGIGKATALKALNNGYNVIGLARRCTIEHALYRHIQIDLSSPKDYLKKIDALKDQKIHALICNAGIGLFGNLEELKLSDFEKLFHINFHSHVALTKAFLPQMKKQSSGDIIYIGSQAALQGKRQGSAYCASKFAIRGFSQALRDECSKNNVRITLINPGFVKTSFFDTLSFSHLNEAGHFTPPDAIADAIDFILSSDRSAGFDEINIRPPHQSVCKK